MHDLTQSPIAWLKLSAWPLWLEYGVDWKANAFHEWLDTETLTCDADYRRLRVVTRQIYVFSQAAQHGVPRAEEAVRLGLDFLLVRARQPDGGYAWRFGLDNEPTDQTRDLYDHAFTLLALASASEALHDASIANLASDLLSHIDNHLRHSNGGYHESQPDQLPRRQNPHMHFFEALLAAHQVFGGRTYFDRATELLQLFLSRLFQWDEGALPEYFSEKLEPERDDRGRFLVESGHHFEWMWLLDDYLKLGEEFRSHDQITSTESAIQQMAFHAHRFGLDPATGLVRDAVWSDGEVRDNSIRLWPQTERLKAVGRFPHLSPVTVRDSRALLGLFTDTVEEGLWRERLPATSTKAPASSLYHLTCALLECERLNAGRSR